jgi:hypothetical protein
MSIFEKVKSWFSPGKEKLSIPEIEKSVKMPLASTTVEEVEKARAKKPRKPRQTKSTKNVSS